MGDLDNIPLVDRIFYSRQPEIWGQNMTLQRISFENVK